MPSDEEEGDTKGGKLERYCKHCGTVEVFMYSDNRKGYYCQSCGAILEEGMSP